MEAYKPGLEVDILESQLGVPPIECVDTTEEEER